ncbi:FliG C-terminal domain-containing protein, partial [Sulfuricurvum sp.]
MSQRAKDAFVEELQFLGAVKMKEVEGAQRKIVDAVQALAEQGILQLGESEEMVE